MDLSFVNGNQKVPTKVFDLISAKERLLEFDDRIQKLKIEANDLIIDSDVKAMTATEMMGQVKSLLNELDGRRKEIIKQPDGFVRTVNGFVRSYRLTLEKIISGILKPKFGEWSYRKELERRKEEQRMIEAQKAKQAELDREAEKSGVDKVQLPDMKLPDKNEPVRTESGTASTIMVWKAEIVDADKVPRKYCSPDQSLINQAVKGGIRKIAGVKIFEEAQTRIRIG